MISVDFKNMKATNRELLINKIEQRMKSDKAETLSANLNLANTKIQGMSLSQLQALEDQMTKADDGNDWTPGSKHMHFPDVKDFSDRQKISGLINASIRDKAVKAVADSQQVLRDTSAALAASKDGTLTQAQEDAAAPRS